MDHSQRTATANVGERDLTLAKERFRYHMRFLHIEDNPQDAELVEAILTKEWPQARIEIVMTRPALEKALEQGRPDLVISDFSLPNFDGLSALKIMRQNRPDVPFVFLSGTIGEEIAVEALKNGATDFVVKDRMGRLVSAVQRALEQSEEYRRRHDTENALEASRERVREQASLLDKARDAICVAGLDRKITYWNAGAEALLGWNVAEAMGRDFSEIFFPEDAVLYEEAVRRLLIEGNWRGELHPITKTSAAIVVDSRWTLVTDSGGLPRSILIINTDLTERKALEAKFLRAQRLESIGTLAGGIAHDLNNVFTPVLIAAEMLQTKTLDMESRQLLATIEKSALHGASLVKQVLLFARGADSDQNPIQLHALIEDISGLLRETLPRSIELHLEVARDLSLVRGNATQLNQVLMNLCVNARDAMPSGGRITIVARNLTPPPAFYQSNPEAQEGRYIFISVTDTGTGIPKEIIDRIFDPFFTTKEIGKGTGLGLSTALGIVKSHKGVLQVTSEVNRGTCFEIYLPAMLSAGPEQTRDTSKTLPRGQGGGRGILVIDDEQLVRDAIVATLRHCGYQSFPAPSGEAGIELYRQHRGEIALALVDMMMPGIDGATTLQRLRQINPQLPLVAMSGMLENGSAEKCRDLGNVTFVRKPLTAVELVDAISTVLGAPGKTRAS